MDYVLEKVYNPDFVLQTPRGLYLIEAKGYFQDANETQKYDAVKKSLASTEELVFVFEDPDKGLAWSKPRKDGSKRTHAEWCRDHGFRYYSMESLPILLDEIKVRRSE